MNLQADVSRHLRRFASREDGAVAIVVALMLPLMLGMVALVEVSKAYGLKNQLQSTADAAAMASVREVPTLASVRSTALDFAHRNMPADGQYGDVLTAADVEMGNWDGDVFVSGAAPSNAVRVTTQGEMPLLFTSALRNLHAAFSDAPVALQPEARAIALTRLDKCYSNGFVAGGIIDMNSSNTFASNFCVYGRGGVTMNSSNQFEPGAGVGMMDLADLTAGGNNPGLQDALFEKDVAAPAAGHAMGLIDQLIAGGGPRPAYITQTVTVAILPTTLVAGTMYIHIGLLPVAVSGTRANIAIISNQTITIKSNSNLRNVLLASRNAVNINSNVRFGDADYCTTGQGASLIISGGTVDDKDVPVGTNSNIFLYGVQVLSDGRVEMNSNLTIAGASIQATENIVFNSSFDVAGCPNETSPNVVGEGTMVSQLVD